MNALIRWYQIRIVNVNVNIIVAGLLALIPTAIAAHLAQHTMGIKNGLAIACITFAVDGVADVGVYYILHWIANHMPKGQPRTASSAAYGHLPYLHDATLAQFERMCLSPILYIIALGGQYVLPRAYGLHITLATAVSFTAGILATRFLHTIWMLKAERRALAAQNEKSADVISTPADS